jgi:hypothetical protein
LVGRHDICETTTRSVGRHKNWRASPDTKFLSSNTKDMLSVNNP